MTKADLLKYIDERLTQRSDGNIGLLMVRQYVEDNMEENDSNASNVLDCVRRKEAIDAMLAEVDDVDKPNVELRWWNMGLTRASEILEQLPSAQPTLYGYNIEHLELIARVLQKEDLPPERVVDVLTDIGHIVGIIRDEFEETLRATIDGRTINGTERTDRPNL